MKRALGALSTAQLREMSFLKVGYPRAVKPITRLDPDLWLVGLQETEGVVFSEKHPRNPTHSASMMRKWKEPPGSVRALLQQPEHRPAHVSSLEWNITCWERERVGGSMISPRERKGSQSLAWISHESERGMLLDGVAVSMGNGADRRFR
eukprot:TRINITY_DN18838_c0_g2_i1.p2 TRINITY_DN18838_c0_g2~~TRINITY_DN18838_c0_g2_i1.p2  ORF type:complete len:150 (-),score=26.94 TRINITY_DN18838_c0_g2_i1:205-654(-)